MNQTADIGLNCIPGTFFYDTAHDRQYSDNERIEGKNAELVAADQPFDKADGKQPEYRGGQHSQDGGSPADIKAAASVHYCFKIQKSRCQNSRQTQNKGVGNG